MGMEHALLFIAAVFLPLGVCVGFFVAVGTLKVKQAGVWCEISMKTRSIFGVICIACLMALQFLPDGTIT